MFDLAFFDFAVGLGEGEIGNIPNRKLDLCGMIDLLLHRKGKCTLEPHIGQVLAINGEGHAGRRSSNVVDPAEGMAPVHF